MASMARDEAPDGWDDPMVREVRDARERVFAAFDYDLEAYVRYLGERQEEARRRGVTIVPVAETGRTRSDAA